MADELLEITDDSRNDWMERNDGSTAINSEHVSRSRLRVDTRKWILSKVLPKVYGDKISAEVTGKDGVALVPTEVRIVLVGGEGQQPSDETNS